MRASADSDGLNEEVGGKIDAVPLFADRDLSSRGTMKTRLNPKSVLQSRESLFSMFRSFLDGIGRVELSSRDVEELCSQLNCFVE